MVTWPEIGKYMADHLPKFFYFSDYSTLEGRIDLQALLNKVKSKQTWAKTKGLLFLYFAW